MPPAVESPRSLAALIALLCAALLLPVILFAIGLPPKAMVYRGPFAVMGREFYGTKGDIDVLVFGSSLLRIAVDKTMLERALAAKLGRPARVVIAGPNWAGLDLPYFLLRDLLSQRRVHMAILAVPIRS